jgi:PAS domain S-box-containing protein
MRSYKPLSTLPVLILSAKADDTLRQQLLTELVQDYVVKPFSAAELRARIRNLAAMKQARDLLQEELAIQSEDIGFLTHQLIASKRTIQDQLDTERKLSALVDNSHDFIGFTSIEGKAVFVNPAGRELVGLTQEQVKETLPLDYIVDEDHQLVSTGMTAALEKGNWEGEVRFRNFKTGVVIPMFQHIFIIKDPSTGQRIGLATISRDLTERKRFEGHLRQAQAELAHVSRVVSMGELTASIAHEINQPLSAIVGNANACTRLLNARSPDLAEIRAAVTDIADSGKRASEIVSGIRGMLTKSQSDRCQLGINNVIAEVLPLLRGELDEHGAQLHTELQHGLPLVLGDRVELQQVLINLLKNGMEAMTSINDRTRVLVVQSYLAASGEVVVCVRDSGVGLSTDQTGKMFNAFFTTKAGGMGMGLAICRTIIEAHGGKLWATANQTGGATFQFALASAA